MIKNFFIFLIIMLFVSNYANAYIGIGPLLPLLGSAIMYIFVGIIMVMGLVFYPVKKIYTYFKNKKKNKFDDNKDLEK